MTVAAIVATVLFLPRRDRPETPSVSPLEQLPDTTLVAMTERVRSLQRLGRYRECIPYARELLRQYQLRGRLEPGLIVDYSGLLNNAAFEIGDGRPRSSFERIAFERQALDACQRVLAMAKRPRERSEAITMVGLVHEAWGFHNEAYLAYRTAVAIDPTNLDARQHLDTYAGQATPASGTAGPG